MDDQQQRGPQDPQMQQQGGPSAQQGGGPQQGGQQSQFGASSGQQDGAPGGSQPSGSSGGAGGSAGSESPRGGNPYTDFFTRRGTSPFELLKRLDEDVDRLFHQFIGGGRELLRSRMRGGMESTVDMGGTSASPSAAGSSGGTDETQTEAAGSSASGSSAVAPMGASGWLPEVEVCERNGKLQVHADLPGMAPGDVQIHFESDQLVLQGERRSTRTTAQPGGYYRTERTYGHFRRVIPLPEGVNPDTAQARFHNGVLEVSFDMPIRHNRSRQIPIQEGGAPAGGGPGAGAASMGGPIGTDSSGLSGSLGGTGSRPGASGAGSEVGP